jgi:hypothetical protein
VKIPDLDGWIPSRVRWRDSEPVVEWIWLGERRFTEPFFSDTLNRAVRNPFTLLFRHETSIDVLGERHMRCPGIKPSGLIFHMSRCGSTLISQLLSSLPSAIAISEAPPLDSLLRHGPQLAEEQRAIWIRWLISALGQRRNGGETHYFIKLDCWHMPYLPILRRALPGVPWIFVYRDPLEVLASHQLIPALWSVPGMLDKNCRMDRLEYCASVIEKICESALSFDRDAMGRFVNYTELPQAVWTTIASHFGLKLSPAEIAAMENQSSFDAKSSGIYFERDSEAKRRRASAQVAKLADRLSPLYERLEVRHADDPAASLRL